MGIKELRAALRQALADYISSEGCGCCGNRDEHRNAEAELAKLLNVPEYDDGSGYDFSKFKSGR